MRATLAAHTLGLFGASRLVVIRSLDYAKFGCAVSNSPHVSGFAQYGQLRSCSVLQPVEMIVQRVAVGLNFCV